LEAGGTEKISKYSTCDNITRHVRFPI